MDIKLEGVAPFKRYLIRAPGVAVGALGFAIKAEAEDILMESKRVVPRDLLALHRSGRVAPVVKTRTKATVEIGYGGDAAAYALAVHEVGYPGFPGKGKHPWTGKSSGDINWSKGGTGAKYLERPALAAEKGMGRRLAKKIRGKLERGR